MQSTALSLIPQWDYLLLSFGSNPTCGSQIIFMSSPKNLFESHLRFTPMFFLCFLKHNLSPRKYEAIALNKEQLKQTVTHMSGSDTKIDWFVKRLGIVVEDWFSSDTFKQCTDVSHVKETKELVDDVYVGNHHRHKRTPMNFVRRFRRNSQASLMRLWKWFMSLLCKTAAIFSILRLVPWSLTEFLLQTLLLMTYFHLRGDALRMS